MTCLNHVAWSVKPGTHEETEAQGRDAHIGRRWKVRRGQEPGIPACRGVPRPAAHPIQAFC